MSLNDRDISALPTFRQSILKTGHENLAEALARRLVTPRGGLFYDPDYGYDLRQHINQEATTGLLVAIAQAVEEECEKDDRVQSASAAVEEWDLRTYRLGVSCVTNEDTIPYAIAISVDPMGVTVIAPTSGGRRVLARRTVGRRVGA